MIVPMKHLSLVCLVQDKTEALRRLRELGVLHVELDATDIEAVRETTVLIEEAERAIRILTAVEKHVPPPRVETRLVSQEAHIEGLLSSPIPTIDTDAETLIRDINRSGTICVELIAELRYLRDEIARYKPFGAFDPAQAAELGLSVQLFTAEVDKLPKGEIVRTFGETADGKLCGVVIGHEPVELESPVPLPRHSTEWFAASEKRVSDRVAEQVKFLAQAEIRKAEIAEILEERRHLQDFAVVAAGMKDHGEHLVWLSGFLPAESVEVLRSAAAANAWAVLIRDPKPGEAVPTYLRPPKFFAPILTLFKALGITPAYTETDISVPFYIFFSIFFAMLVGDAGYGAVILALALYARRKMPKAPKAPFTLITVFSVCTILWGVLTATYFGIPVTVLPAVLNHKGARWFADQSNIMQFCFTLGVLHLMLARVWNAIQLWPDTKALAQVGWMGVLAAMYNIICGIVVQGYHSPSWNIWLLLGSSAMIALFMLKKDELKTNGVDLGMLPLNIISSMGDIISYVRLFAVGMASVKVAENFNIMATSLDMPMWGKIPLMILILLFGHVLNLAMGGLSILVHAVRLNTLEFSGAKGLSWAGFAYKPFSNPIKGE